MPLPSLGFFEEPSTFVYSGETSRGFIYGSGDERIIIVEFEAIADGEVFIEDYLDAIRAKVVESNEIKNQLLIARQNPPGSRKAPASTSAALMNSGLSRI